MALVNFKFDNVSVPFTKSNKKTFTNLQNENETEGGHVIIQTIRKSVFAMSINTTCLSSMAQVYRQFNEKDSFVLSYFDTLTGRTEEKTVHMEKYSESLHKKSYLLNKTDGVYDISFTLEEF